MTTRRSIRVVVATVLLAATPSVIAQPAASPAPGASDPTAEKPAGQGYQESTLDQNKRSHVVAIDVMQIVPDTGASLKVGDIRVTEANIHAGAKYMDQLMWKYFPDARFSVGNRPLFAFASYNAGPGNVAKARREAEKRGLDPDNSFNNVEIVVTEKIGTETTTYVRYIYKYYVSYRLEMDQRAARDKARRELGTPVKSPGARS